MKVSTAIKYSVSLCFIAVGSYIPAHRRGQAGIFNA